MAPKNKKTETSKKNGVAKPQMQSSAQQKPITQPAKTQAKKILSEIIKKRTPSVGTRIQPPRKAKLNARSTIEPTSTNSIASAVPSNSFEESLSVVEQMTPESPEPEREPEMIDITLSLEIRDYVRCYRCGIICASKAMIVEHYAFCKETNSDKRKGFVIFYTYQLCDGQIYDSDSGKKLPYNQFRDDLEEKCNILRPPKSVSDY